MGPMSMHPAYLHDWQSSKCNCLPASRACTLSCQLHMQGEAEGVLCLKQAWPAMFRTLFGAQDRFEEAYFSSFKVRHLAFRALMPSCSRPHCREPHAATTARELCCLLAVLALCRKHGSSLTCCVCISCSHLLYVLR